MLKTKLIWVSILTIIFVYIQGSYTTYKNKLAIAGPSISNDYFDQKDHNTLKFFAERKLEETITRYFNYIKDKFENKLNNDLSNYQELIQKNEFTSMHAANNFDVYEWEQSVSNAKLEEKNDRLLEEIKKIDNNDLQNSIDDVSYVNKKKLRMLNDQQNKRYKIGNLPQGVKLKDIKLQNRNNGHMDYVVFTIFKCKNNCKTIFTKEHIKEMIRFSDQMNQIPEWKLVCPRTDKNYVDGFGCSQSAYGNLTSNFEILFRNKDFDISNDQIQEQVKKYFPMIIDNFGLRKLISKKATAENPYSEFNTVLYRQSEQIYESEIIQNKDGIWEEQVTKMYEYDEKVQTYYNFAVKVFELSQSFNSDLLYVEAFSQQLQTKYTNSCVDQDTYFVVMVIFLCWIYITIHMRSALLSTLSLLNIVMSIPLSLCIYRYVLQITYFSTVHVATLMIIIGIGSDDVFLFHDQWKNTLQIKALKGKPIERLSIVLRRSVSAMFSTSITTACSYFSCYFSTIMPLRAFGIFAALLVMFCYVITIVVQPIIYYLYEVYIYENTNFCGNGSLFQQRQLQNEQEGQDQKPKMIELNTQDFSQTKSKVAQYDPQEFIQEQSGPNLDQKNELKIHQTLVEQNHSIYDDYIAPSHSSIVQKIFQNYFRRAIYFLRYPLFIIFVFASIQNLYNTSQIKASNRQESVLKDTNPLQIAINWHRYELWQEGYLDVRYVWGIQNRILKDPNQLYWKAQNDGVIVFDNTFDLKPKENQQKLYDLCEKINRRDDVIQQIECPLFGFKKWLENKGLQFPIDEELFDEKIAQYAIQNHQITSQKLGFFKGKLQMLTIQFLKKDFQNMNGEQSRQAYENLENQINEFNRQSGEGLNKGFMTAYDNWTWLTLRSQIMRNAANGIIFSFIFSFLILLFTTQNIYMSIIALFSISSIIFTLMSTIYLFGWEFGLIESACVIVFIGISFDYVIHICHEYIHCIHVLRKDRMDSSYKNMGETIFSGALTTSFSGIFLALCESNALNKFGLLLIITILSSLVIALIFLPSVLYIFGPQFKNGDIKNIVRSFKNRF